MRGCGGCSSCACGELGHTLGTLRHSRTGLPMSRETCPNPWAVPSHKVPRSCCGCPRSCHGCLDPSIGSALPRLPQCLGQPVLEGALVPPEGQHPLLPQGPHRPAHPRERHRPPGLRGGARAGPQAPLRFPHPSQRAGGDRAGGELGTLPPMGTCPGDCAAGGAPAVMVKA